MEPNPKALLQEQSHEPINIYEIIEEVAKRMDIDFDLELELSELSTITGLPTPNAYN